jgi:mono/diheme cytochrome c family protein
MKVHKLSALAGAAVITMSNFTLAQAQGDASLGQSLAREVCSECHAVEPGVFQSPNPDASAFQVLANTPGMNAMTIRVWLQSPHRTMPLLVLDGAEIEGVSAYIMSLEQLSP